ncbi:MAG: phosphate-starvation-inducible protein PsiE [Gammaproteobacteria bacterium]|jgi:phosphate starvation-inducible membrane PsiE
MAIGKQAESAQKRAEAVAERLGERLVRVFHLLALFVIGGTIAWSAAVAYVGMISAGHASLHDILLLFVYLELGAMVGIYFRTDELPVEFLLYIAITVITRSLVEVESLEESRVLIVTGSVLVLSLAAVLLRFGAFRFRSGTGEGAKETDLPV